jgi:hypothetical protein
MSFIISFFLSQFLANLSTKTDVFLFMNHGAIPRHPSIVLYMFYQVGLRSLFHAIASAVGATYNLTVTSALTDVQQGICTTMNLTFA